jgi:hypothetical protein
MAGPLFGDEVPGQPSCGKTALAHVVQIADEADELVLGGAESSDVVGLVVGVCAGECLATGQGLVGVQWEDLLDTFGIIWVDNRGNVEVSLPGEAVPSDFSKHAWNGEIVAFGDGVPVANPAGGEALVGNRRALHDEVLDGWHTNLSGEDEGARCAVLVDEVDCVGSGHGCERDCCEKDGVDEFHLEDR